MRDAEGSELVADAVGGAHWDAEETAADGVLGAEEALHAGGEEVGVGFRGEEARDEAAEGGGGVGGAFCCGGYAADGFDAVVDGADAGAEPDGERGGGGEFGGEDDEAGAEGEVLEGVFVVREVVGGAGEGRVFARGEGGGDADYWEDGREEGVAEGRGVEVEGLEGVEGGGVVGEGEGDDFGGVGEAAAAEGDEDVSVGGFRFVRDGEDVRVVRVRFDAFCDADDGARTEFGFEGGDEGGEVVGVAAEGAGGEDVDAAGVEGGGDVVGAG